MASPSNHFISQDDDGVFIIDVTTSSRTLIHAAHGFANYGIFVEKTQEILTIFTNEWIGDNMRSLITIEIDLK